MEKKRAAHKMREMSRDDYALILAQKMMDTNDAANAMQLMLDAKFGNLSLMAHHGVDIDSAQFGYTARDVWEAEAVVSKCNEISAPLMFANGATSLQQHILRQAHELLRLVVAIKSGVNRVVNSITRMIGDRDADTDALTPTLTFYFAWLVETLAAYAMLYEHIGLSRLLPATPSDLMTRVWDLIDQKKAWRDIAGRNNVDKALQRVQLSHCASTPAARETVYNGQGRSD